MRMNAAPTRPSNSHVPIVVGVIGLIVVCCGLVADASQSNLVSTALAREVASAGGERTVLNASDTSRRRRAPRFFKVTGKVHRGAHREGMKVKEDKFSEARRHEYQASLSLAQAQLDPQGRARRDACAP